MAAPKISLFFFSCIVEEKKTIKLLPESFHLISDITYTYKKLTKHPRIKPVTDISVYPTQSYSSEMFEETCSRAMKDEMNCCSLLGSIYSNYSQQRLSYPKAFKSDPLTGPKQFLPICR